MQIKETNVDRSHTQTEMDKFFLTHLPKDLVESLIKNVHMDSQFGILGNHKMNKNQINVPSMHHMRGSVCHKTISMDFNPAKK